MKFHLGAVVAGLLFGAGLTISGLTQPSKVFGFLDVSGSFDASLLFAMAAGVAVLWVAERIARRARAPLFAERFPIHDRTHVDLRLLGGAAVFGVGWGLAGLCPGPALASFAFGVPAALLFVPAMAAGMLAFRLWEMTRSTWWLPSQPRLAHALGSPVSAGVTALRHRLRAWIRAKLPISLWD